MSPPITTHAHPAVPPEHRRRWLIGTLVVVVVAVSAIVGAPWLYARVIMPDPREALTLSTPVATAPAEVPATADVTGSWQVGEGSQAGYRLGEVLSGEQVTVVGRTEKVVGSVVVADGALTQAEIMVDTASITTDESARDAYFRRALDTTTYPQAVFSLAEPADVAAVGTTTEAVAVQATGTLTFHGVSQPVTVDLQVRRTLAGVEVAGQVPITLSDFGLEAPDLGFVTVEPTGSLELLLVLTR